MMAQVHLSPVRHGTGEFCLPCALNVNAKMMLALTCCSIHALTQTIKFKVLTKSQRDIFKQTDIINQLPNPARCVKAATIV